MVLPHGTPPPPSPRGGSGGGGVASWCGVRSSCGCDAVGGLGLLVRCRRGSGGCWCAAAGGLGVLVRCRRWSGVAGALPQGAWGCWCAAAGGLGVVSERASTGRLTAAVGWALGLRPGWDARFFVRALEGQGSAFATGSRRERRSVRASAHEGRIVGALGGGVGSASPFSWHGPREGRSAATADPLSGGFSTAGAVLRLRIHRWHAHTQILASSASDGPRTRAAAAPSRPVEALAERRTSRSRADAAAGRARSRVNAAAAPLTPARSTPRPWRWGRRRSARRRW